MRRLVLPRQYWAKRTFVYQSIENAIGPKVTVTVPKFAARNNKKVSHRTFFPLHAISVWKLKRHSDASVAASATYVNARDVAKAA